MKAAQSHQNLPRPIQIWCHFYTNSTNSSKSNKNKLISYTCPLNPPQSFQVIPSLHKSKRIDWNPPRSTQTARIHKKSNKSNQSHQTKFTKYSEIYPINMPNRWNHVKSAQINKKDQIHQNLCKSTRIVLNPAETTEIDPNKPNPTQSSNCNEIHANPSRSTYTERIYHRITILNTQAARFRELPKQLQITRNSQHLI